MQQPHARHRRSCSDNSSVLIEGILGVFGAELLLLRRLFAWLTRRVDLRFLSLSLLLSIYLYLTLLLGRRYEHTYYASRLPVLETRNVDAPAMWSLESHQYCIR